MSKLDRVGIHLPMFASLHNQARCHERWNKNNFCRDCYLGDPSATTSKLARRPQPQAGLIDKGCLHAMERRAGVRCDAVVNGRCEITAIPRPGSVRIAPSWSKPTEIGRHRPTSVHSGPASGNVSPTPVELDSIVRSRKKLGRTWPKAGRRRQEWLLIRRNPS